MIFVILAVGVALILMSTNGRGETVTRGKVLYIERANGVDPRLLQALRDWSGDFDILVAGDGGVRTDEALQQRLFTEGRTNARTLYETPHGHGGAIDVWPVGFNPNVALERQPTILARFVTLGAYAKSKGFTWGGDWKTLKDYPHWEVKDWKNLPMPSKGVS